MVFYFLFIQFNVTFSLFLFFLKILTMHLQKYHDITKVMDFLCDFCSLTLTMHLQKFYGITIILDIYHSKTLVFFEFHWSMILQYT